MIGLKILGFGRIMQTLMIVFLLSLILSLAIGSSFEMLSGIGGFLQGFDLRRPLLMDSSARSIYTSIIPVRLARDIVEVLNIRVDAVVATLGYVDGVLAPIWDESMLGGSSPSILNASSCILGGRLAGRLGKGVGDVVTVVGILGREVHILRVVDVRYFDDPRGDYLFVSGVLARRLRGIRDTEASIIIFNSPEDVLRASRYLSQTYELGVSYDVPVEARLRILASDGSRVLERPIVGRGFEVFRIPFGYYRVVVSTPYADILVALVKLNDSARISIKLSDRVVLRVLGCPLEPELRDVKGVLIKPDSHDNDTWVYSVPPGLYALSIAGRRFEVPLISDLELRPCLEGVIEPGLVEVYHVRLEVVYIDGKPVDEVYLTVLSDNGGLVVSRSVPGMYELDLRQGDYSFIVRRGSYVHEERVSVQADMVARIVVPLRSDGRIPYSSIPRVKLLPSGYDPLGSITLMILSAELALLASIIAVSFLAYRVVFSHFFESSSVEIGKMVELRLSRKFYLRAIYLPMLVLILLTLFVSVLIAIGLALGVSWPIPFSVKLLGSLLWPYFIVTIPALISYTLTFFGALRKKGVFLGLGASILHDV